MKKSAKLLKKLSIILAALLVVGFLGISVFSGISMINGVCRMNTNEQTKENSKKFLSQVSFDLDRDFADYKGKIERGAIPSSKHSHEIPFDHILAVETKDADTVILVHGLGGDRTTMYPLAKMFLLRGYNVLAYDQRNSGDNQAKYNTFGYLESDDLQDCVDYLRGQVAKDKRIGVVGQSMGGATVGIYAGRGHATGNVDFVVLDSPIGGMERMIRLFMAGTKQGMPLGYLVFCGNLATKIKLGFSYGDADAARYAKSNRVPTLIIHSKTDEVAPFAMGKEIFDAIPHEKKEFVANESGSHIAGFYENGPFYTEKVLGFIEKYAPSPRQPQLFLSSE